MIYAFRCPACFHREDRDLPVDARNFRQDCRCGRAMRRVYSVAVHIPIHMRAAGDDVVRQIMPGAQEAAEEGVEPREVRQRWLQSGVEQGVMKRYRHDLE